MPGEATEPQPTADLPPGGDHRRTATAEKHQEPAASDLAATSRPATEPPKLSRAGLLAAQQQTLAMPRRRAGIPARLLFTTMDLLYGRRRTLSKFKMLELIARVPSAEHEYMEFVAEHPGWETEPFESAFTGDYGRFDSLADLFRQIGHDERVHKQESLAQAAASRFR